MTEVEKKSRSTIKCEVTFILKGIQIRKMLVKHLKSTPTASDCYKEAVESVVTCEDQ